MTLTEQVFAQAMLLSGTDSPEHEQMMKMMCHSAVAGLTAQLRDGICPADCIADFVAAASLYALAALSEADAVSNLEQIQIGDVTMRKGGGSAAARCLRTQAEMIMWPYLQDRFSFRGV